MTYRFLVFILLFKYVQCTLLDVESENINRSGTRELTEHGSFQLKMYWEQGYAWNGSEKEQSLCATCLKKNCDLGSIILKRCDGNDADQKWEETADGKIRSEINPSVCLSYRDPERVTVKECATSRDYFQLVEIDASTEGKMKVKGDDNCITANGSPSEYDRLKLRTCGAAERNDAAYWAKIQNENSLFLQLKLHWEKGYNWNGVVEERSWCASCSGKDCTNGSILLKECNKQDPTQRWSGTSTGKIRSQTAPNYCVSFEDPRRLTTEECRPNRDNYQRMKQRNFEDGRFELIGKDRCVSTNNYPEGYERLRLISCNNAARRDASYWVFGEFSGHPSVDSTPTQSPVKGPPNPTATPTKAPVEKPTSAPVETPTKTPFKTPTKSPVETPAGGDPLQLKLYWEKGYQWNNGPDIAPSDERSWCAQCSGRDCTNGSIVLRQCDLNEATQRWTRRSDGKIGALSAPDFCVSFVANANRVITERCRSNQQTVDVREYDGGQKVQLRLGRSGECIATGGVPSGDERLRIVRCVVAERNDASFWVFGEFSGHPAPTGTRSPVRSPVTTPSPTKRETTPSPTKRKDSDFDTNRGFYNSADVCEKKSDGMCPCYPEDDDWYCPDRWYPWDMSATTNNVAADVNYGACDVSKFQMCGPNQKLCPMRKPRLDRWYGDDRAAIHYYIDYDCIQCVPRNENCSKCSPGIWCEALKRCVPPGRLTRQCKRENPDWDY